MTQIPKGSVAVSGSKKTESRQLQLAAFSTQRFEYFFYFPRAGEFTHYPAHVSTKDEVLAVAENVEFKAVDRSATVDKSSWIYVSQNGTDDEVIEYLNDQELFTVDLDKVAFRMRDKAFCSRVINSLKNRFVYNHTLWSYGIKHRLPETTSEFLSHDDRVCQQVGPYLESELLQIEPLERNWYQYREYSPLVNARIHQVGSKRTILNPAFHAQYHQLLNVLSCKSSLTSDDQLVITYYLLLQDRIAAAIEHFSKVKPDEIDQQMQYDYCDAYIHFYLENPDQAEKIASRWKNYPVDLWRNRFKDVIAQVAEIRGADVSVTDTRENSQQQTKLASESAAFDFTIVDKTIKVSAQAIDTVTVNFYEMDIELMFSRSPFAESELDRFSVIVPTLTQTVELDGDSAKIDVPEQFAAKNVLVEIQAQDQVKSQAYLANSMNVQTIEKYGQLQVTSLEGKPMSKTYVKVYSMRGGQAVFHKDGYTDLRGRFDYVTQSNNSLDGISKYSILVMSDTGATTRQASPPAE